MTSHDIKMNQDLDTRGHLIERYMPHDGRFELSIPGTYAIRVSRPSTELNHSVHKPGLCIVAQGAKSVILGSNTFEYNECLLCVYSVEVPVASQVIRASQTEPYLCFTLDIEPERISELVMKVYPHGLPKVQGIGALQLGQNNAPLYRRSFACSTYWNSRATPLTWLRCCWMKF